MQLTQCIKRAAQVDRDGIATIFSERQHTWSDFSARVSRLAGGLRALGVKDGDRVAMLALNSDRYLEYYFAIPWAGAVVVPMNIRWSPAENAYSLNDSGARVMIVDDAFTAMVPKILAQATVDTLIYAGDGETPDGMLNYEALIADNAPPATPNGAARTWPASFTPAAPPAFPRASCCRIAASGPVPSPWPTIWSWMPARAICTPRPCSTWPTAPCRWRAAWWARGT